MHFLKEIPVHEMQKLRKEEKRKKSERRKEERKEEWKKERIKERRVKKGKKKSREWKVSLNVPSYTVEWRGTDRRGALETWRRCQ